MSDRKQSRQGATGASDSASAPLYGFVLTDQGPVLYYDLVLWRGAFAAERKQRFCDRPFGRRRARAGHMPSATAA